MKYLVAVSGGVDSVVLLDMLAKRDRNQLIVAHFDHGIRPDSKSDAQFVKLLARKYNLPFVLRREELGEGASEERARLRRYRFLRAEAAKHDATIVTAHHHNDLLETIAINISRGTGWRGLAVFGDTSILRPLLGMSKEDLYVYALKQRLEWVEDDTNSQPVYLRNRIRARMRALSHSAEDLLSELWHSQTNLRDSIERESQRLMDEGVLKRYFFIMLDVSVGMELLRTVILKKTGKSPLRPQLERALLAIKTAKPDSVFQIGEGVSLRFTTTTVIVEPPQKVL